MTKFHQVSSPPGRFSVWMLTGINHKMACCDCGLVHDMQFRPVKVVSRNTRTALVRFQEMDGRYFAVIFRARRNKRSTAAKRRENRKKKT